ncbi:MAG: hypothetical protein H0X45_10105 [Planctomycetes bacterium]|nr:hypothetical protein [Planctomycetota bacterium]
MRLFLDSADPAEIHRVRAWGVLDGVTTNPALVAKRGGDMRETLRAALDASPGEVFCQAIGWDDAAVLKAQARWLHGVSERVVVKLPMSRAGIQALGELKREVPAMPIAVTMVASVAQALLCGKLGADVVALFNGPLEQALDQPVDLVRPVRAIYANYGYATKILSCGRMPRSVGDFAAAGSDICTLRYEFFQLMYEHPYTDKRAAVFAEDWTKAFGDRRWPDG